MTGSRARLMPAQPFSRLSVDAPRIVRLPPLENRPIRKRPTEAPLPWTVLLIDTGSEPL